MNPLKIGLTGGIGTGKSSVAAMLGELGAAIVSGDDLGKRVLEDSPVLLAQVRERFGDAVFSKDGRLVRRALGDRVFARPDDAQWLTQLTFPGIHALWMEAAARCDRDVIVFDAALILEWGIEAEFDLLLVVVANMRSVTDRLNQSGRLGAVEVRGRLGSQIPPEVKAARAQAVIRNDTSLVDLRDRTRQFWIEYVEPEILRRSTSRHESSD